MTRTMDMWPNLLSGYAFLSQACIMDYFVHYSHMQSLKQV